MVPPVECWHVNVHSVEMVRFLTMRYVVAGVLLVGTLCILDMLMTFAVLRRLRDHSTRFAMLSFAEKLGDTGYLERFENRRFPEFSVTTTGKVGLSSGSMVGRSWSIGFFSAGCAPCHEQAPAFGALGTDAALAVVTGTGRDAEELLDLLPGEAMAVTGADAAALAELLDVTMFPTFLEVNVSGRIVRADATLAKADATVTAGSARS
ncbi:hypothetical protein LUW76_13850 [Actinomadura madurae]|uniref:hypothetical protein n=1 Tax=Actinomadura madurae TaxID=1993 RepID=UPI002026FA1F|nr:hypothetical protein [Actinomadura madurae]URM95311.1 hypothetical protein LUW76_13850 [Actinomadura madurae]URN06003.1 hypothetical protein LUW74_23650 [Actinomadura madurae]